MKQAKGDRPIETIPQGTYEAGMVHKKPKENSLNDYTTDGQNNGYPVNSRKEGAGE